MSETDATLAKLMELLRNTTEAGAEWRAAVNQVIAAVVKQLENSAQAGRARTEMTTTVAASVAQVLTYVADLQAELAVLKILLVSKGIVTEEELANLQAAVGTAIKTTSAKPSRPPARRRAAK